MRKSIICRSYSCSGAPVIHAGHVGNVLWPSIAFRQWLGSEYPQITSEREDEENCGFYLSIISWYGNSCKANGPVTKEVETFFSL